MKRKKGDKKSQNVGKALDKKNARGGNGWGFKSLDFQS